MTVPALDLIIWDMDGTLLQSTAAVPDSFIETAAEFGRPGYTRDEIFEYYRLGVPENVVAHLLGRPPTTQKPTINREMDFFYKTLAAKADTVQAYPGIVETLEALTSKVDLAVFTGASHRSAAILLEAAGLATYFKHIEGGDEHGPKPDPGGILYVAETLRHVIDRVAYIGDAPYDMEAAVSAGAVGLAAGWGHLFEDSVEGNAIDTASGYVVLQQPSDLFLTPALEELKSFR